MWQVDGGLDPDRAVASGVLHDLAGQPRERVGRGQDVARREIRARERGEAPEAANRGNLESGLAGQLVQGLRPHGAFEVDVKMGLREPSEIAHGTIMASSLATAPGASGTETLRSWTKYSAETPGLLWFASTNR